METILAVIENGLFAKTARLSRHRLSRQHQQSDPRAQGKHGKNLTRVVAGHLGWIYLAGTRLQDWAAVELGPT